jgi:hypothetical protein
MLPLAAPIRRAAPATTEPCATAWRAAVRSLMSVGGQAIAEAQRSHPLPFRGPLSLQLLEPVLRQPAYV